MRGLAAIGTAPGLIGLLLTWVMPESPRWLLSRGRFQDARRAAAKQLGVAPDSLPLPSSALGRALPANVWKLLADKRAFWLIAITSLAMSTTTYGYQLWAPIILSLALHLPVGQVAGYFTYIGAVPSVSGFALYGRSPRRALAKMCAEATAAWRNRRVTQAEGEFPVQVILIVPRPSCSPAARWPPSGRSGSRLPARWEDQTTLFIPQPLHAPGS